MNTYEQLIEPFYPSEIEWRIARSGVKNGKPWAMVLAYVTNRAIMNRLDEVFGYDNWKNEFTQGPNGGLLCGISVRCKGDYGYEWITKYDGADNTQVEEIKGGLSGAMKRAAVQWGIGRYLYNLPTTFAYICEDGDYSAAALDKSSNKKIRFKWNPPTLPSFAMPSVHKQKKDAQLFIEMMELCPSKEYLYDLAEKYASLMSENLYANLLREKFKDLLKRLNDEQASHADVEPGLSES